MNSKAKVTFAIALLGALMYLTVMMIVAYQVGYENGLNQASQLLDETCTYIEEG